MLDDSLQVDFDEFLYMMVMVVGIEDIEDLSKNKVSAKVDREINKYRNQLHYLHAVAKIVFGHLQVLLALGGLTGVYWPPAATRFFDAMQVFYFLGDAAASFECMATGTASGLVTFYDTATVAIIMPPLLVALLFSVTVILDGCVCPCKCKCKCRGLGKDKDDSLELVCVESKSTHSYHCIVRAQPLFYTQQLHCGSLTFVMMPVVLSRIRELHQGKRTFTSISRTKPSTC